MELSPLTISKKLAKRVLTRVPEVRQVLDERDQLRLELAWHQQRLQEAYQTNPMLAELLAGPELTDAEQALRDQYVAGGKEPWSVGYGEYRKWFLTQALANESLLDALRHDGPLPAHFGHRVDERCIEFPWTIAHLRDCGQRLLDAGSTLNHLVLLQHPVLAERKLIICTLAPEGQLRRAGVSYLYSDLRCLELRDGCLDALTCISTLEHIGMDNTLLYTPDQSFNECDLDCHLQAVAELRRVLKPGGVALITVPFGVRENHGWTQQFDRAGVQAIIDAFAGRVESWQCFRYLPDGWTKATIEECANCKYFNFHATGRVEADGAIAARAVACLRLIRE